ncbi:hypothetical protein D1007_06088 [Hordeum vulgare]|nr:hypothetical protein D1007_06088 [Hordeum vulgare]
MQLANLVERERLERLLRSLDARAARDQPSSSRRQLFLNNRSRHIEVMRTRVLYLAAANRIADSIQLSDTAAGRGIRKIQDLLKTALQQNSTVSPSRHRIRNKSVQADTMQSARSPHVHRRHQRPPPFSKGLQGDWRQGHQD